MHCELNDEYIDAKDIEMDMRILSDYRKIQGKHKELNLRDYCIDIEVPKTEMKIRKKHDYWLNGNKYTNHVHADEDQTGMRICKKCKVKQPLESFNKNAQQYLGRHLYCKKCTMAARREYFLRSGK